MLKIYAVLLVLVIGFASFGAQFTVEEKTLDFQQLIGRIKSSYGPLQYKKDVMKIDIDQLQASYLRRIQESKNNEEFYYLINQFVAEFKDSHFGAQIPTTRNSLLPFFVELVQGKILVEGVNPDLMKAEDFSLKKGDEIVSIDGVSVNDLTKSFLPYVNAGSERTRKRIATWLITTRRAAAVPMVDGDTVITLNPYDKSAQRAVTFKWLHQGEEMPESLQLSLDRSTAFTATSFLQDMSVEKSIDNLVGDTPAERRFRCSGDTRIDIPEGATIISKKPFVSYYWSTPKGNIGYVRLPHYSPSDTTPWATSPYQAFFLRYERTIAILEKNTVGMIIDQDHNCGGSVDLVNQMVGLFMDKPFHPFYFRLVANKENYLEYKKLTAAIDPLASWFDSMTAVTNVVKDSWLKGERLTPFVTLDGIEWLQPNLIHYTKPVVMLIDEISGSGGDAFPAMMQGYGRAKLLGVTTMGAGGHVTQNAPLNYSQITVSMTRSMFFRPDGVPIENNGAVPDYPYEITVDDFMNGYRGLRDFYTGKLLGLVPDGPALR
ncbi:MAG: PDZ domain-containing protein [Bdellovibrionaceae bacterium]|nr:PDZ domain-containing protein [Pseudobdellovibrionaceae bacterium]